MNKVNLTSLFLSLLLIVGICLALTPTSAKAANIPSDKSFGNWDPTTNTYTLGINLTEGIVIDDSNFTLDGDGYTVTGDGWGRGVYLSERQHVTIKNLIVENFYYGIYLSCSDENTLIDNTASSNECIGIVLDSSSNNTLKDNTASSNTEIGILLDSSSDNKLIGNIVSGNDYGIYLYSCSHNTLEGNTVSKNTEIGIYLQDNSSDNKLIGNTVSDNGKGIELDSSTGNTIYNNYFNNNTNVDFDGNIYFNTWNTTKELGTNIVGGPNLGGNFWAKPNNDGFSQTHPDADGDGFCDEKYTLATDNVDNLPLALARPQVVSVTLNPPSPVKAGLVTFTIVFSEDMENNILPTVTFGRTDLYDEHTVTETDYSADTWVGTFTIEAGYDGEQNISISGAKDLAGNPMDPDTDTSHTFLVDTTSPAGSILINGGASYTNSQSVTLSLSAENAAQMHFSNDNASWSSWESYSSSRSWTLSSGDGEKTVYVQFKDSVGNLSETYSDTIILDTTSPTGTFSINSGDDYTNSRSVTLSFNASSSSASLSLANASASLMRFKNEDSSWSSWESYSSSRSWTLSSEDGKKTVYAEFKDPAGNVSKTYSGSIILHRTPPTVAITSPCAESCLKGEVAVEGTATDDYFEKYEIEFAEGLDPSSWHQITSCCFAVVEAELCCWNVSSLSDGTYTLKLTAWDLASNFAEVKVALKVDNHPPQTTLTEYPSEKVTGNTPKAVAAFSWIGSDPDNITPVEKLVYQYRLEGHSNYQDWSGWSKDSSSTFLLPSGNYTFKVRAKDEAGNYPSEDDSQTARYSFTVSLPLIIYPNPCYLNQAGFLTFSNLALESEVRIYIYDVAGSLVRSLGETDAVIQGGSKACTWNLKNDNGEMLTRGIYIYYILSATEKRSGKIAIIN
ncbi:hypothetical protein CEE34_05580 [Candidatus Aerophobetes bacterium Ae_b3a]|nr:MAG: hypothetical protein CEE34_05580 [Candidatus Aerophobetes bacterium Ae_b3a]